MPTQVEWANIGWRGAMRDRLFVMTHSEKADPVQVAEMLISDAPKWVHARTKTSVREAAKHLARRNAERADLKDVHDF